MPDHSYRSAARQCRELGNTLKAQAKRIRKIDGLRPGAKQRLARLQAVVELASVGETIKRVVEELSDADDRN